MGRDDEITVTLTREELEVVAAASEDGYTVLDPPAHKPLERALTKIERALRGGAIRASGSSWLTAALQEMCPQGVRRAMVVLEDGDGHYRLASVDALVEDDEMRIADKRLMVLAAQRLVEQP